MRLKNFLIIWLFCIGCSSNSKLINYYSQGNWDSATTIEKVKTATQLDNIDEIRSIIVDFKLPDYRVSQNLECESVSYTLLVQQDGKLQGFFANKSISPAIDSLIYKSLISAKFKPQSNLVANEPLFTILLPFTFQQGKISSILTGDFKKPASDKKENAKDVFVPFDFPPTPVGGFEAIKKKLRYPEIARKAGIEGKVMLQFLILESAEIGPYKVLESPLEILTKAAYEAVKQVKWKPATRDGRPCTVWVSIPITFRLK